MGRTLCCPSANRAYVLSPHCTAPSGLLCVQVVAGAGAIDHEQLVQLAGKAFGSLPNSDVTASDLVEQVPHNPAKHWLAVLVS